MLTISVWPRRLKEFLLTHPLYKSPALGRVVSIRSGFRYCFAIAENFGVQPQVSPVFDPASSVQASRRRVAPCETWAAPSFSPPLHQSRIAATRPFAKN